MALFFNGPGGIVIPRLAADPSNPANGEIYYNTSDEKFRKYENGGWSDLGSGDNLDDTFVIKNAVDDTKEIAFDASQIATGTTRTIQMPDTDVNLGDIAQNTSDISTLSSDVSQLQSDVSTLQSDVSTIEGNITTLSGQISDLETDVGTLETSKANVALDNLSSVAINADLEFDATDTYSVGSLTERASEVHAASVETDAILDPDEEIVLSTATRRLNHLDAGPAVDFAVAGNVKSFSPDAAVVWEDFKSNSVALTGGQGTPQALAAIYLDNGDNMQSFEMDYMIRDTTTNAQRFGTLKAVISDDADPVLSLNDINVVQTDVIPYVFSLVKSGDRATLNYTSTGANNGSMFYRLKRLIVS